MSKMPFKEAMFYSSKDNVVTCTLCPHNCSIPDGKVGICGARKNDKGMLIALNYGKAISLANDPVEKKPLFHFLPGMRVMSFGTNGCNFFCQNCQNFDISQVRGRQPIEDTEPSKIVELAIKAGCDGIAYTYNEPTIFYEYMLDTVKIAKRKGLRNIMVSNGFINKEPLLELIPFLDAANIDLKSMDDEFYQNVCKASLEPVLSTIKLLKEQGVWLELTNLIIPGENDSHKQLSDVARFVSELGDDVPLHFSRFFPLYQMRDKEPTPEKALMDAKRIAEHFGLKYVYLGNLRKSGFENTVCPSCKKMVIVRDGCNLFKNSLKGGKCPHCGFVLQGVWE